jgi:hypothetical protein
MKLGVGYHGGGGANSGISRNWTWGSPGVDERGAKGPPSFGPEPRCKALRIDALRGL